MPRRDSLANNTPLDKTQTLYQTTIQNERVVQKSDFQISPSEFQAGHLIFLVSHAPSLIDPCDEKISCQISARLSYMSV